jgi:hypothetical protein
MKKSKKSGRCGIVLILAICAASLAATEPPVDIGAELEKAKRWTAPGANHKELERFLGQWDTETRLMLPTGPTAPEKGTATYSWLMEGRWVKGESSGSMMGFPIRTFGILGYDNFKMSYVTANVNSFDTTLTTSEGDMDPSGKAILAYGTLDEYLTGEHDKMVKYVWRFLSADEMVLEVHDLPIGEKNTQVIEIRFKRRKV